MTPTFIAGTIFLITYAVIATERLHKTIAALAGAMLIILSGTLSQEEAFASVDWNVIFLLIGMMIIANTMRHTGVFTWLAVMAAKLGDGRPMRVLIIMCLLTAVASALLDNVTTVVIVAPVTIYLAGVLRVSPVPMLLAEVFASNIGGAATLIGDPPNILIGSAADIHFIDFAGAMLPISVIGMVGLIVMIWVFWRNELQTSAETIKELDEIDTSSLITNPRLLRTSLIVLSATVIGFFLHGIFHLEAATIAMTGAAALMVITRPDPHDILVEVEWTTLSVLRRSLHSGGRDRARWADRDHSRRVAGNHGNGPRTHGPIDSVALGGGLGISRQHPIYGSHDSASTRSRKRDSGPTPVVGSSYGR